MAKLTNPDGTPAIKCQNADCENDKHCFRPKPTGKAWKKPTGDCQYCGESPVDWERIRSRDLTDIPAIRDELKKEWIRNHFWDKPIDAKSIEKLQQSNRQQIRSDLRKTLAACVGPPQPFKDGQRVPIDDEKLEGQPFAYAQHATASCCTKCAFYWWGLERNTQYTDEQIDFLTDMCVGYLEVRGVLPEE